MDRENYLRAQASIRDTRDVLLNPAVSQGSCQNEPTAAEAARTAAANLLDQLTYVTARLDEIAENLGCGPMSLPKSAETTPPPPPRPGVIGNIHNAIDEASSRLAEIAATISRIARQV